MHIPVFSALAANKRWNGGAPDLMTLESILQAQKDASYWADELRMRRMPAFDVHNKAAQSTNEIYHLERFRFLSYIHNEEFWVALVEHLERKDTLFWAVALDSAIESGNVHALNALNVQGQHPLQALFFEWLPSTQSSKNNNVPHPRALQWFAKDPSLHNLLREFSEKTMARDYATAMLSGHTPLWWDSANQTNGAQSVIGWTRDWCALPASLSTTKGAVSNALAMLTSLNRRDRDSAHKDAQHANRMSPQAQALASALEKSVAMIGQHANLPPGLIRTLAGRMTPQDLTDPMLCAVVQYQDPHVERDKFCVQQQRRPLRNSEYMQVVHNASRAEPLPTLLDMQCPKGTLWEIYKVAEPFVSQRPVQCMDLPADLLDLPSS